ncbi:electron transport complex subunit RsxG [Mangrovibacter phragmitis]|uniref:Ion-translocating oxidoreductase complex subunit G n=1 Tax=Mangrovibacter phragmitis TaxID=1691903 RepID=A0A1B7L6Z0_9ENTR|nr:electron transport complex subunit RsxG [Mangrovibacter phragmitis]OAT78030.1 electron transport complex subunit RsxG [Mangrovibacter phragmitis]
MLNTMRKHGVTLALFAAGFTGLVAVVNTLTQPVIAHQAMLQQKKLFDQVIAPDSYDNAIQQDCVVANNTPLGSGAHDIYIARNQGKPVAVVMQTTAPDGYGGAIQLLVASDFSGTVLGTRVTEQHETPGLGDKIDVRVSNWILGFAGKQVTGPDDAAWAVKKDGGQFDQFTGATITPRAVVNAVKRAALFAKTLPPELATLPSCGASS